MDREKLVEEHTGLVKTIVEKIRRQFDLQTDSDDLISCGYRGLLEAADRFDPSRGVRFNTFAYYRIRGAVLDGVRQMAMLPRRAHEQMKQAAVADALSEEAHAEWSGQPAAKKTVENAVSAVDETLARLTAAFTVGTMGGSAGEVDTSLDPEERLLHEENKDRVRTIVQNLPEKELALIRGFYFEGRRFDEVAEELGISKSWASRLHTKALDMIREALEN